MGIYRVHTTTAYETTVEHEFIIRADSRSQADYEAERLVERKLPYVMTTWQRRFVEELPETYSEE